MKSKRAASAAPCHYYSNWANNSYSGDAWLKKQWECFGTSMQATLKLFSDIEYVDKFLVRSRLETRNSSFMQRLDVERCIVGINLYVVSHKRNTYARRPFSFGAEGVIITRVHRNCLPIAGSALQSFSRSYAKNGVDQDRRCGKGASTTY